MVGCPLVRVDGCSAGRRSFRTRRHLEFKLICPGACHRCWCRTVVYCPMQSPVAQKPSKQKQSKDTNQTSEHTVLATHDPRAGSTRPKTGARRTPGSTIWYDASALSRFDWSRLRGS